MTGTQTKKVFTDFIGFIPMRCEEAADGRTFVTGRYQLCDEKNGNNRVYSTKLWEKQLARREIQERISRRLMLGHLEHPADGQTDLSKVSHVVVKLWKEGNQIFGKSEILDTPMGLISKEFARKQIPIGVSSRGRGTSIERDGVEYINEDDYDIETFDFVCKPSTPEAYQAQVNESLQGPYRPESPVMDKKTEIRRIRISVADALTESLNATPTRIADLVTSLTANEAKLSALKTPDTLDEHDEVLSEIQTAKTRLDERLIAAMTRAQGSLTESAPKSSATPSEAAALAQFWFERYQATKHQHEGKERDSVLLARVEASEQLAERLLASTRARGSKIERLNEHLNSLGLRVNSLMRLLEGLLDRHIRTSIVKRVRAAVESNPKLERWVENLLQVENLHDLDQEIKRIEGTLAEALPMSPAEMVPNLPKKPKAESAKPDDARAKKGASSPKGDDKKVRAERQSPPNGGRPVTERHVPMHVNDDSLDGKGGDKILAEAEARTKRTEKKAPAANTAAGLAHAIVERRNWN